MTALETTRNRDHSSVSDGSALRIDSAPIMGTWVNFDTEATGITRLLATTNDGRLELRVTEAGELKSTEWHATQATALADGVDQQLAVGFLAKAELGPALGSRLVTLCAYLNRGLLTIDAHTATQAAGSSASYMARAHFYRSDTGARE